MLLGCATVPAAPGAAPQRNPYLITAEEISASKLLTAHHAVSTLRPNWLHTRGAKAASGMGSIVVYLDATRMGGPDVLREIPATEIRTMRFLNSRDAQTRYGEGHEHGAIVVITP